MFLAPRTNQRKLPDLARWAKAAEARDIDATVDLYDPEIGRLLGTVDEATAPRRTNLKLIRECFPPPQLLGGTSAMEGGRKGCKAPFGSNTVQRTHGTREISHCLRDTFCLEFSRLQSHVGYAARQQSGDIGGPQSRTMTAGSRGLAVSGESAIERLQCLLK